MKKESISDKSPKKRRIAGILLRIFGVLLALLVALILALNIPAVQTYITGKIIDSIRERTGTAISLGAVKISFPRAIEIKDVYVEDKNADTLFYLQSLIVNVQLLELLNNKINVSSVDLENVVANIRRVDGQSDFNYQFILDALSSKSESKSNDFSATWSLNVKDIALKNIRGSFIDQKSGTDFRFDLNELKSTVKEIDLEKSKFRFDNFILDNTSIQFSRAKLVETNKNSIEKKYDVSTKDTTKLFSGLDIAANTISLNNIDIQFDDNSFVKRNQGVDYNHIHLSKFNTTIHDVSISQEGLLAEIQKMNFNEACGLSMEKLSGNIKFSSESAELNKLYLETSRSKISGDAKLSYSSLANMSEDLGNGEVMIDFNQSIVNSDEIILFVPALAKEKEFDKFGKQNVLIAVKAKGKINDLEIENLNISALKKTTLATHGRLTGLPNVDKLSFKTKIDLLSTVKSDLYRFIDQKSMSGLNLPEAMNLNGVIEGNLNSLKADVQFNSSVGNIIAKGIYKKQKYGKDTVDLNFTAANILVGNIIGDTTLGKATVSGKINASRTSTGKMSGVAKLNVSEIYFNSYRYSNIDIACKLIGDSVLAELTSTDPNAKFELVVNANLRESKKQITADLNLAALDFHALHFSENKIIAATNLKATLNYEGLNNADGQFYFTNTSFSNEKKSASIKKIDLKALSTSEGFNVGIESDLVEGRVSGNILAADLEKTFVNSFKKYFNGKNIVAIEPGKQLDFSMNVHLPKEVVEVLTPNLKVIEISKLEGNYNSDNNDLNFELKMPGILYSGIMVDTLNVFANGKDDKLALDISCNNITYSGFSLERLNINETTDQGGIVSEISVKDTAGEVRYLFANEFEFGKDFFKMHFLPDGLILNSEKWKVENDNYFVAEKNSVEGAKTKYTVNNFIFSDNEQTFGVETDAVNHKFLFKNFKIQNLLDIVSYGDVNNQSKAGGKFIKGDLNAEVAVPVAREQNAFNVDLAIKNLYVVDTLAGDLVVKAKAENDILNLDAGLTSDENKILIKGVARNYSHTPELDLVTTIDIKDLHRLEHLTLGYLSEMSGKLNGEIHLTGTTSKPELDGALAFDQSIFKVNSLNFLAKIEKDKVKINSNGIHFDKFSIRDVNDKKLEINGDILTKDFSNYNFDLNLSAKGFQPVNSTIADNKTFYGKLSLGADINIKGDIRNPQIIANIEIDSATNLTYALPGSELKLISSEGVVQFIDSLQLQDSTLNAIAGDFMTDSILSKMKGLDLQAHIQIDHGSRFTIYIDPNSGDYLTVNGNAKLDITSNGTTGEQSINGVYEVNSGFYQLSFYDLVKKNFTITPGSTVAWSGRPMDADLNITAEYVVRTTSIGLVANESSSMSEEEKKIFNKRLPYEVKLNIRGFLAKPEISFSISLPQQYLSDNPLVETKLRQLNAEDMEAQLNKQVFALLVAGSFMAENPTVTSGSSSNNLASTAARNSVNGILAGQLNSMSSKYINGVDVNFGLTSYEDYAGSSGDTRTEMDIQVSKKLFNDRITVEAENSYGLKNSKNQNSSTPTAQGYGQFAVIYSLTETGEYKLRAYYQNAYDPFDGDISYSGIAILFEKEFDRLKAVQTPVQKKQEDIKK